ncbi:MAG: hypothetical protein GX039_00945 [Clostridia bacterium]|nr:hypothetical protein [Clostridia bacterium]
MTAEIVDKLTEWLTASLIAYFDTYNATAKDNADLLQDEQINDETKKAEAIMVPEQLSAEAAIKQNENETVINKAKPVEELGQLKQPQIEPVMADDKVPTEAAAVVSEQEISSANNNTKQETEAQLAQEQNKNIITMQVEAISGETVHSSLPQPEKVFEAKLTGGNPKRLKQRNYPANPFVAPAGEPVYPFARRSNHSDLVQPPTFGNKTTCSLSTFAISSPASLELSGKLPETIPALKNLSAAVSSPTKDFTLTE